LVLLKLSWLKLSWLKLSKRKKMEINRYFNLRVDSKNRAQGTSDNWITQLPQTIQTSQDAVCMLSQAIFPVSWYTISESNNVLYVAISNGYMTAGGNPVWYNIAQLNIPPGYYDVDSMSQGLQQELTAIFSLSVPGTTFTVQSTPDGRISISVGNSESPNPLYFHILSKDDIVLNNWWGDNPPFVLPQGALQNKDLLANATLGFHGSNLQNPGPNQPLLAPGLFNSLGTNYVLIHSNMQQLSSQGPGPADNDVVGMIPVLGGFGTLNAWQCSGSDIEVFSVANMSLHSLNFYLTNDSGQRLDLRGGNVALSFMIYDRP
jgi:hypothetical protein